MIDTVGHKKRATLLLSISLPVIDRFFCATAGAAIARLSHHNSVLLSVCPSITRVYQSKMVQARITKFSPSAARKTLVLGTIKLFRTFEGGHTERKC